MRHSTRDRKPVEWDGTVLELKGRLELGGRFGTTTLLHSRMAEEEEEDV